MSQRGAVRKPLRNSRIELLSQRARRSTASNCVQRRSLCRSADHHPSAKPCSSSSSGAFVRTVSNTWPGDGLTMAMSAPLDAAAKPIRRREPNRSCRRGKSASRQVSTIDSLSHSMSYYHMPARRFTFPAPVPACRRTALKPTAHHTRRRAPKQLLIRAFRLATAPTGSVSINNNPDSSDGNGDFRHG